MSASIPVLSAESIHKSYGCLEVLKGVSLQLHRGEVITILGPSGCGKSTLLRCMNLLEHPDSGSIFYNGKDISQSDPTAFRRKIGMVFQHFNVFPHLTATQNLTIAPVTNGMLSQEEADRKALALLERVGLADKKDEYPARLSGGQKQRLAIARAILKNPSVLVLDEATSALDTMSEAVVQEALDKLMENRTTVIIAHRLSTVRNSDLICVLKDGVVEEQGSHAELLMKDGLYRELYAMQLRDHNNVKSDLFSVGESSGLHGSAASTKG